jgi:hypothetical protein
MSITMNHSTGRKGRALLSVHDVTPGRLSLLADILGDLADRGVSAVNLAIVPRFHGEDAWSDDAAFRKAVAAPGVRTEVMLHGYFHLRTGENERLPWPFRFRSRLQSDLGGRLRPVPPRFRPPGLVRSQGFAGDPAPARLLRH